MRAIIDCRIDEKLVNNYLELNLWGKPCYEYVIDAVIDTRCFSHVILVTESEKIAQNCKGKGLEVIRRFPELDNDIFIISGRAPCISSETIKRAVSEYSGRCLISSRKEGEYGFCRQNVSFLTGIQNNIFNAFCIYFWGGGENYPTFFCVPDKEAVVINSPNEFELALVLKRKQQNRKIVLSMIETRIKEKRKILLTPIEKSICLIGHSQFDQWDVSELGGYNVRNCGISGISSFEYNELILKPQLLDCSADLFLILHGTNDIVEGYTLDEIMESIENTIEYIRNRNACAPLLFLSCIHTNGRMDRNNCIIEKLNTELKTRLKGQVIWIDTSFMNNNYGELDSRYTSDGLHINYTGYEKMKEEIIKIIKEIAR